MEESKRRNGRKQEKRGWGGEKKKQDKEKPHKKFTSGELDHS